MNRHQLVFLLFAGACAGVSDDVPPFGSGSGLSTETPSSSAGDTGTMGDTDVAGTGSGGASSGTTSGGSPDSDGDGTDDGADCDPYDDEVFPGAAEVGWDGIDQDCDGRDLHLPKVAAGYLHNCALDPNGAASCWGLDFYGETDFSGGSYSDIDVADYVTCAISAGEIVCEGYTGYGQTASPAGSSWVQISVGGSHACAVDTAGVVDCWGLDFWGQSTPAPGLYSEVTTGYEHSCGIDKFTGEIRCWGRGNDGQLAVPIVGGWTAISSYLDTTCALSAAGVYCWGWDDFDQAGAQYGAYATVGSGAFHSCTLDATGAPYCWGSDLQDQLAPPTPLAGQVQISTGVYHTCATDLDGEVTCWGGL